MTDQEFDWTADDSVAVQDQPAIAVYPNPFGQVVDDVRLYRQQGTSCEAIDLGEIQTRFVSKDSTGAERQRRYRNRHRNGNDRDVTDEAVTPPAQPLLIAAG